MHEWINVTASQWVVHLALSSLTSMWLIWKPKFLLKTDCDLNLSLRSVDDILVVQRTKKISRRCTLLSKNILSWSSHMKFGFNQLPFLDVMLRWMTTHLTQVFLLKKQIQESAWTFATSVPDGTKLELYLPWSIVLTKFHPIHRNLKQNYGDWNKLFCSEQFPSVCSRKWNPKIQKK